MTADGKTVQVRLTPPAKPELPRPLGRETVSDRCSERAQSLCARLADLRAKLQPFADRTSELLGRTSEPGFYQDHANRDATFDELHKLDQFLSRWERVHEPVERLVHRIDSKTSGEGAVAVEDRLFELESELNQIEFIANCHNARDLSDAFLLLTLVKAGGAPLDAVEKLARTYLGLAVRRHFDASVVGEHYDEKADRVLVHVLGLGAFSLFAAEAGLHEFNHRSRQKNSRTGREQTQENTSIIRVEVFALLAEPDKKFTNSVQTKIVALKPARSRMVEKARWQVTAFHEPSVHSIELGFADDQTVATARAIRLLHAQTHSGASPVATVIRRYDLGIGSSIKDLRTGRRTPRLAQFFRGHIEMLDRERDEPTNTDRS